MIGSWVPGIPLAEVLYNQALEIIRTALGEDHPDFGGIMNNCGILLCMQKRYEEENERISNSKEIFRESLGEDHPDARRVQDQTMIW